MQEGLARVETRRGLWHFLGSHVAPAGTEKTANKSLVLDLSGHLRTAHEKLHIYDVELAVLTATQESRHCRPGRAVGVASTPWRPGGLSVFIDVRFQVLYRDLPKTGPQVLLVPEAFPLQTGPLNWRTLVLVPGIKTR